MIDFHQTLSQQSVHFRYFGMLSLGFRTGHERLVALCSTDRAREIALVADHKSSDGEHAILGVGRLIKTPGLDEAEFAILVTDRSQGDGLGSALWRHRRSEGCSLHVAAPDQSPRSSWESTRSRRG